MIALPPFSSPRFPDFNPSSFARGRSTEMMSKFDMMRAALAKAGSGASAIRLRGADWVSWALAGADPAVLLTTDLGVAEVLVTAEGAWVLTDTIESARLVDEEIPAGCSVQVNGWESPSRRESFVVECAGTGRVLSDRPRPGEALLPDSLVHAKRTLCATELERYRIVGRLAAQAMTETLTAATSATSERALAGMGAKALWDRGLHPALTLCAGARRLPLHRHATPTHEPLGSEAMLVFCARGFGLYACLTRFVTFDGATSPEAAKAQEGRHALVRELEAVILDASVPGATLPALYETLAQAYVAQGADAFETIAAALVGWIRAPGQVSLDAATEIAADLGSLTAGLHAALADGRGAPEMAPRGATCSAGARQERLGQRRASFG